MQKKIDHTTELSLRKSVNRCIEKLKFPLVDDGGAGSPSAASGGASPPSAQPPGSSGGGNDGKKSAAWWFISIATAILACFAIGVSVYNQTTDMGKEKASVHLAKINRDIVEAQEKTKQMLAEKTPVQPVQAVRSNSAVEQVFAPPVSPDVLSVPTVHEMFDCASEELLKAGFVRNDIKRITGLGEHQFSSGCAWVVVSTSVRNMTASDYAFHERLPDGSLWGCGDTSMNKGVVHSNDACAKFLRERVGKKLMLVIQNGGIVTINSSN